MPQGGSVIIRSQSVLHRAAASSSDHSVCSTGRQRHHQITACAPQGGSVIIRSQRVLHRAAASSSGHRVCSTGRQRHHQITACAPQGGSVIIRSQRVQLVFQGPPHTPSTVFRHLPPNSARFSYAIEGALFISAQLSTDAVSALRKV